MKTWNPLPRYLTAIVLFGLVLLPASATERVWRSHSDDHRVSISWKNDTRSTLDVYWVDYGGRERLYQGRLAPGASGGSSTFPSHVFVFKRGATVVDRYLVDSRTHQRFSVGGTRSTVAQGRLQAGAGTVLFQPVNADKAFQLASPSQSGNVHLTLKPKLHLGADGAKYLEVDMDGSIVSASVNSSLAQDDQYQRGWFVDGVTTRIVPLHAKPRLFMSADLSSGGESGSITSTTSTSLSLGGGASANQDGGELSAKIGYSYSVGNSYSRNLRGFSVRTPVVERGAELGGATAVANDYELTGILYQGNAGLAPYVKPEDLVDKDIPSEDFWGGFASFFTTQAWYGFKVHGLPRRAKAGLPLVSQAVYSVPASFREPVKVRAEVTVELRRIWVTGDTKFDARWHSRSRTETIVKDFIVDFGFDYPASRR